MRLHRDPGPGRVASRTVAIISGRFSTLKQRRCSSVYHGVGVANSRLGRVVNRVRHLGPGPNSGCKSTTSAVGRAVAPSFVIRVGKGSLVISLGGNGVPRLRMSPRCGGVIHSCGTGPSGRGHRVHRTVRFTGRGVSTTR